MNFHTHTNFVDGKTSPEEVVQSALKQGLTVLGFSEHAFVPFDLEYSMNPDDTEQYRREIALLKEKYAGQIEILCGTELDAFSPTNPADYDYVIGSVHYLKIKGEIYSVDASPAETMRCVNNAFGGNFNAYAKAYYDLVAEFCGKLKPNIIGHVDLLTKYCEKGVPFEPKSNAYQTAWQTCVDALVKTSVFEVNTGAMSRGLRTSPYPANDILQAIWQKGGRVILSADAHHPDHLLFGFEQAEQLTKQAGFTTAGFTAKNGKTYTQF